MNRVVLKSCGVSALALAVVALLGTIYSNATATATATPQGNSTKTSLGAPNATQVEQAYKLAEAPVGILQQLTLAHPAFERTWVRTDQLVAQGQVARTWYWGPQSISGGLQEDYVEGAGGKRLVQYFDKGRMELNNPNADPTNPFFVTNEWC
jgi:hypothetical protein